MDVTSASTRKRVSCSSGAIRSRSSPIPLAMTSAAWTSNGRYRSPCGRGIRWVPHGPNSSSTRSSPSKCSRWPTGSSRTSIHGHLHEGALLGGVLGRLRRVPLVFDFQGSLSSEIADHQFVNPHSPLLPIVAPSNRTSTVSRTPFSPVRTTPPISWRTISAFRLRGSPFCPIV